MSRKVIKKKKKNKKNNQVYNHWLLVFYYISETFVDDFESLSGTYTPPAKIENSFLVLYFMGKCVIWSKEVTSLPQGILN